MANQDNQENKTKKIKLSYATEYSLLGLMLAIISLIALVNYGYIGAGISYGLAFMFGYWYPLFLVVFVIVGLYTFFKKKKPKSLTTLTIISFVLLIIFLSMASSKYQGACLENYYAHFFSAFEKCHDGLQVNFLDLYNAKGGLIGFSLYAFFDNLMGEFMTSVVIVVCVITFAYLAFRKPIAYLYIHIMAYFETSDERKLAKENAKKTKEAKRALKLAEKESKMNKLNNKSLKQEKEINASNCEHPFTFDIFTQPLFDKEESINDSHVDDIIADNIDKEELRYEETKINKTTQNEIKKDNDFDNFNSTNSNIEDIQQEIINSQTNLFKQKDEQLKDNQDDIFASDLDNETLNKAIEDNLESDGFYEENFEYEFTSNKDNLQMNENIDEQIDEQLDKAIEKQEENNEIFVPDFAKNNNVEIINENNFKVDESKKIVCSNLYDLLKDNAINNSTDELKEEVEENCNKINQKLEELNIKAKVSNYIIGPCVTRYEIVPDLGVRVSSIVNIQNDLKLALAAVNLRMEAPIPGKSAVGIEVANKKRYPVYLKEVLEPFKDNKDKLLVAIGKNLNNEPVSLSIDKMPHLLIAGATGSGKSVCINGIIMSLILRSTPDEVKLILVDPKKVEMLPYANMPHLLCPVVTDPKKANNVLKKVVVEMDHRYDLFASHGVRNIDSYNQLEDIDKLAKIVVIIDELADLMLACSKEVEESIQRITQLARAAGIYLIVATQRPSVDVITGVIKANIPSRIAFSVSSMVDSRTILDKSGAEDLLGKGDMLMDIAGTNSLNRVQGVFVSDKEIIDVVNVIKERYDTDFNEEFLNLEDDKKEEIDSINENGDDFKDDPIYEDIKAFVIKNQRASTSILLRHFSIGYIRASKIIDRLEQEGIIGPLDGSKPREVLIKKEDLDNEDNN